MIEAKRIRAHKRKTPPANPTASGFMTGDIGLATATSDAVYNASETICQAVSSDRAVLREPVLPCDGARQTNGMRSSLRGYWQSKGWWCALSVGLVSEQVIKVYRR